MDASGTRIGCVVERFGAVLRPSWGILGGSWKGFRESWGRSGTILGALFKDLLPSEAKCENSKKPMKTNGFSLIFEVLGGLWGSKKKENSENWLREAKRGKK